MNTWFVLCVFPGAFTAAVLGVACSAVSMGRRRAATLLVANAGTAALAVAAAYAFRPSLSAFLADNPWTVIGFAALAFLALGMGLSGEGEHSGNRYTRRRRMVLGWGLSALLPSGVLIAAASAPEGALRPEWLIPGMATAVLVFGSASYILFRCSPGDKAELALNAAGRSMLRGGVYLLVLAAVSPEVTRISGTRFQPLYLLSHWAMAVILPAAVALVGLGLWIGGKRGLVG